MEQVVEPRVRRWTKGEFHQMADLGWFQDQRAELIEGEVVVLSPQKFLHGSVTDRVTEVLRNRLGQGFWVRMQLPLDLGTDSEPEPDVSVVLGHRDDYDAPPREAVLVVEVSETTLAYDRGPKAGLYAHAGIQEYWIVNLIDHQLEIHRSPMADPKHPGGFRFTEVRVCRGNDVFSPLTAPRIQLSTAELIL